MGFCIYSCCRVHPHRMLGLQASLRAPALPQQRFTQVVSVVYEWVWWVLAASAACRQAGCGFVQFQLLPVTCWACRGCSLQACAAQPLGLERAFIIAVCAAPRPPSCCNCIKHGITPLPLQSFDLEKILSMDPAFLKVSWWLLGTQPCAFRHFARAQPVWHAAGHCFGEAGACARHTWGMMLHRGS